ncbi:hypothetical protein Tco_0620622 [Tanacetum coccineum]
MTRSSNTKVFTPFANPERQFWSRKDTTPLAVHNIYSFYESESSESEPENLNEINIETLTLEQYLALNRNNSHVGVKRPGNGKDIVFEIKSQLLRELRKNTFFGGKTEYAMEHLQKIVEIAGAAKRWLGRTSSDLLKTWDELKQVFIQRFCPPSITFKQIGEIHNFRQEEGETLSIQEIVDHSLRWHKEESDKKTSNNSLSNITDKLKNLNHDMNNLRENIHKINLKSNMEFRYEEVKDFDVIDNIEGPDDLEEFLTDDDLNGDLGNFL